MSPLAKKITNSLVFLSVIFVAYFAYRIDWSSVFKGVDYSKIIIAVTLFFFGFLLQGVSWGVFLRVCEFPVNTATAVRSVGATILAKYIPGKIWMLLGRAGYVAHVKNYSLQEVSKVSIKCQIVSLVFSVFVAMLVSLNAEVPIENIAWWQISALIFFVVTMFFLIRIRFISAGISEILLLGVAFSSMWFCWGISFYFVYDAVNLPFYIKREDLALIFIFSSVAGILAFIFPGGLGVREGGIIGLLALYDLPAEDGAAVAILARVCFLIAEVMYFAISVRWKGLF